MLQIRKSPGDKAGAIISDQESVVEVNRAGSIAACSSSFLMRLDFPIDFDRAGNLLAVRAFQVGHGIKGKSTFRILRANLFRPLLIEVLTVVRTAVVHPLCSAFAGCRRLEFHALHVRLVAIALIGERADTGRMVCAACRTIKSVRPRLLCHERDHNGKHCEDRGNNAHDPAFLDAFRPAFDDANDRKHCADDGDEWRCIVDDWNEAQNNGNNADNQAGNRNAACTPVINLLVLLWSVSRLQWLWLLDRLLWLSVTHFLSPSPISDMHTFAHSEDRTLCA